MTVHPLSCSFSFQSTKWKVPPDIRKEEKTLHSDDGRDTIEDSLAEESLLNDTGVTELESEIKYQTSSEKDSSLYNLEEIQHKISSVTETHTNLKRAYV